MARQQQGVNAVTVWLIVFVALWLTSTVFLVILFTDQEKLRQEREALLRRKQTVATDQEENAVQLPQAPQPGGPTMVGLLESARGQIAEVATGDSKDDAATVRSKAAGLIRQIQTDGLIPDGERLAGASLHATLQNVHEQLKMEHRLRDQAEQRAQEFESQYNQAIAQNTAQQTNFDEQASALQAKLNDCQSSRDDLQGNHNTKLAELEQQYNKLRADMNTAITEERQQKGALQERYAELLQRYSELQNKIGSLQVTPAENATARQADGRVRKAVPGDDIIYIDLGARDALVLGMEFAVYDADRGIPVDGQAKARIRVEAIHPSSAECKVMARYSKDLIMENDLIANPIYDKSHPLTFVVIGDFDLNRDGRPDDGEEAGIEALVKEWGGQATTDLTALTDFIIVGDRPQLLRGERGSSDDLAARNQTIQARVDRYEKVLQNAGTLSIPVLPQNVFLQFLGYSNRPGVGGTFSS